MTTDQIYEKYEEYYEKLKEYRQIVIENKNDYHFLSTTLEKMYQFLKSIAPIFYFVDDYIDTSGLFRTLSASVKVTEGSIPDNHFIIPSEPSFIYQKGKSLKPASNNSNEILDWLVYTVREQYAYTNFENKRPSIEDLSFEDECTYMSKKIASLCLKNGIDCSIKRINLGFEETARLHNGANHHDICIVTINDQEFLVDCSYRQFFMLKGNSLERIGIPYLLNTKPGIFMTLNSSRLKLANIILSRGWISLTDGNIKNYFDGFALSFRNGLYYDETGDYSFTTNYSALDYRNFLEGIDNQVKHEGEKVLQKQTTISKCHKQKIIMRCH